MMRRMEKPPQPPEGLLIRAGIHGVPGMTIRGLAARVDLSEARIRQYINGYASAGRGQYVSVEAPADRLAQIAAVLDINTKQLIDAGRADAAAVLEDLMRETPTWGRGGPGPDSVSGPTDDGPEFEFLTRVREDLTDEEMDQLMKEARPYLEMLVRDIKNRNRD